MNAGLTGAHVCLVPAPRGIAVERWPVGNPWDIGHPRQCFLDLAVREDGRETG
jgi:hypothetical protein